jgi:hypothetical protein
MRGCLYAQTLQLIKHKKKRTHKESIVNCTKLYNPVHAFTFSRILRQGSNGPTKFEIFRLLFNDAASIEII